MIKLESVMKVLRVNQTETFFNKKRFFTSNNISIELIKRMLIN